MMLGMDLKVGYLKLADLIGLDVVKTFLDNLFNEFKEAKYQPSILLNSMFCTKMLGKKSVKVFITILSKRQLFAIGSKSIIEGTKITFMPRNTYKKRIIKIIGKILKV